MTHAMRAWRAGGALLLACLSALAQAQPVVADDAAERARIERDRQAVLARHAQAERQCAQRFQVTDCLDNARAERRQALGQLRREQAVLDDARRRARAAERLQGQQRRLREREAQALMGTPLEPAAPASSPPAGAAPARAMATSAAPASSPVAHARTRAPAASDSHAAQAAAHARRVHQAERHAEAVRQRNAASNARKPPAAGLPVPGASGPAQP